MGFSEFLDRVTQPLRTSTEDSIRECKADPSKCLTQLMLDGAVIVLAYAALLYLVDGKQLAVPRALKFYVMFVVLAYVLRYLDVDFADQITRVAGFQLGTKLFLTMAT